jgi:hypothetical protein
MMTRILFALCLSCCAVRAADPSPAPAGAPSEASIKELLSVSEVRSIVDTMWKEIDAMMKNAMQQATQGRPVAPNVQRDIDQGMSDMMKIVKEELNWDQLEPLYVRVYQKSLTQAEVDGMLAFYKTPTGQALIKKMPVIMRTTMVEMQQRMGPMMQKIQKLQQDVMAKVGPPERPKKKS